MLGDKHSRMRSWTQKRGLKTRAEKGKITGEAFSKLFEIFI